MSGSFDCAERRRINAPLAELIAGCAEGVAKTSLSRLSKCNTARR